MPNYTRSDKSLLIKIDKLLDTSNTVTQRQQKIKIVKKIFAILTSNHGANLLIKIPSFKQIIQDKLHEFYKETDMIKLVEKWYQQIFNEPIPKSEPEPEPEPESESEPELDNTNPVLEQWIEEVTVCGPLTRERHNFLAVLFETLEELTFTRSQKWIDSCSKYLWKKLSTDYGQTTLEMYPELRTYLEKELYGEYVRPNGQFWADYWPDIFGCEIDNTRYYLN